MNNSLLLTFGVFLFLTIVLVFPLRRGQALDCDRGVYTRMQEMGLPFAYYQAPNKGNMICVPEGAPYNSKALGASFSPAPLWFDLVIDGGVALGALLVINRGLRK